MGTVIPYPGESRRPQASGVRIAYVADRWCIERLVNGIITRRSCMPTRDDARRVVIRISRRDKAMLLPMHAFGPTGEHPHPDDAA
ncbi:hypothetical protein ASG32_27220 [Methylobacterium sp. Leaf361]|uniref:hypothetical protein n=1 Tax=Methylobacterium sp. Leaf361 TaxID=1736352 RepID=UPI0006F48D1D|nr:hypothetical protein [Methylobacterium sp. Leaf361]KQS75457.1 hypothetical protein ASG32_27220 [Methylobacterium sp. Leaf361]